MFFLTPRYVKQGRQFVKDARKLLAYRRDVAKPEVVEEVEREIARLDDAVKLRDEAAVNKHAQQLDQACGKLIVVPENAWIRENWEVLIVAITVALGVRTYFLQPFTIPTGSMQPTLNGIIGYPTTQPPPNPVIRVLDFMLRGREWINVVAEADEQLIDAPREMKRFGFFTYTRFQTDQGNTYWAHAPKDILNRYFPLKTSFTKGEPIARGYVESGDMVFVDKMTYHFRKPRRDEVFVFNTQNIGTRENVQQDMRGPSQYYIKRLVGLPGDTLQIKPPELLINGERAKGEGMERVMSGTLMSPNRGFRGYANASLQTGFGGRTWLAPMNYLNTPEAQVTLGPNEYYALGDNSYHSSDSRDWGPVPERNLMGRGIFVYWPFLRHWGFIR